MPGDEIGVEMRFDDVADAEPQLFGGIEIDGDIALRIDHGGDSAGADHIRGMGETAQIETLNPYRLLRIHSNDEYKMAGYVTANQ